MRTGFEPAYDGFAKRGEGTPIAEDRENKGDCETRSNEIERVEGPVAQSWPKGEVTDGELERAIVQAVTMGLGDVARTLAGRLEERRHARAGNVVAFDKRRRRDRDEG